jgi:hypothetical protein
LREPPRGVALEHNPKELLAFFEGMLQLLEFEQFLFGHAFPREE